MNGTARPTWEKVRYRVIVELSQYEWELLARECHDRGITGTELIEVVLSQWIRNQPPIEDAPLPDDAPEDA